jgi:ribosomal protein S18 acetylase RimI-like enzyme
MKKCKNEYKNIIKEINMEKIVELNELNIRLASTNDIISICILYDDFFNYNNTQQPFFCADVKESGNYPKNIIEGTTGDIFVSEIDKKIIGFIHVEEDKTPQYPSVVQHKFACIIDFYVMPEHRKKGIGKLLLEKAKEWSIQRNLEYLELFVLEENEIGRKFYEKESFITTSRTMRLII